MWTLPGEETRPAGGTRWSGTIRLPEENAFRCQSLEARSRNRTTIRAGQTAGIVGMNVKNIERAA